MQDVESKFKANNLHFSIYGAMHKYEKQMLQAKSARDTLKHNHFKGLDNLKNAITSTHLTAKKQVRIEILTLESHLITKWSAVINVSFKRTREALP